MSTIEVADVQLDVYFAEFIPPEIFVTNKARRVIEIALELTVNFIISLLGIFTNIIVISVFVKQGFKDSVGISMTAISMWDLIKCLGGFMQRCYGPISLFDPAAAFSWSNISVVIFNYLGSFSTYVTSVLAAYVAVERCLCVTMPLKVKWLLTPKLALIICTVISVSVFGYFAVIFGIYDVVWVYNSNFNTRVAIYKYNRFSQNNTNLFYYYNMSGALWPLASLVVIVISTVIISYKLKEASKFRLTHKEVAAGAVNNASIEKDNKGLNTRPSKLLSKRDQQVVKMLLVIIVIFIVNLVPRVAHYLAKYFIPEFYYLRQYHNLITVMAYVVFTFDFLNGSVNLFVFLAMSSSFRSTYIEMFPFCFSVKPQ
ncbi:unnamed protein product [Candidula unifasciata]|uniref:G-protein coupled receptors family 1 profile domain-containing protein n=1 Tax=Candidula unifasciata TaxID=100452 RepID=A0A8S3YWH0_9EUPU|nr:unnamed protein product [Candidula unifasciata]